MRTLVVSESAVAIKPLPGTSLTPQLLASHLDRAAKKGKLQAMAGGSDRSLVPFEASAIRAALDDGRHKLSANKIVASGEVLRYRLVPVEEPQSLAVVAEVLRSLTKQSGLFGKGFLGDEFSVLVYANAAGEPRTFVAQGYGKNNDFPKNFAEPSGDKWSLVATVAHTHLGRNLSPSQADRTVMRRRFEGAGQQRALLVSQKSGELFFEANAPDRKVDLSELSSMQLNSLFD